MPEMHRNSRLLYKHNFQSQHVSPQQGCVMKLAWIFFFAENPLSEGQPQCYLCEEGFCFRSWDGDKGKGKPLFMPRKRRELVAVQKSSQILSLFSRESNLQGIWDSVVLASRLFSSPACAYSPLCIFCIWPQQAVFLIAPWKKWNLIFQL